MSIKVNISIEPSIQRIQRAFEGHEKVLHRFIAQGLEKIAFQIEGESKRVTPVDTGRLRSSIATNFMNLNSKLEAKIGTDVEYAIYVHEGTRYMKGRPFMEEGVDKTIAQVQGIMEQHIEQSIDALRQSI